LRQRCFQTIEVNRNMVPASRKQFFNWNKNRETQPQGNWFEINKYVAAVQPKIRIKLAEYLIGLHQTKDYESQNVIR